MDLVGIVLATLVGVAAVGVAVWVFRRERAERARDRARTDAIRRAQRLLPIYEAIATQLDVFDAAAQRLSREPLVAAELDELDLAVLGDELNQRFSALTDDVDRDGDHRAFTGSLRHVEQLREARLAVVSARCVPAVPASADLEAALRQWDDEHRADALHQHLRDLARSSAAQAAVAVETANAIRVLRQHTDHQINQARELLDGRTAT